MARSAVDDATFIDLFDRFGATEVARRIGTGVREVQRRRARIEAARHITITSQHPNSQRRAGVDCPEVLTAHIDDGVILIGSDSHYWPGIITTGHLAFLWACREFKPKLVVKNGDELDFPSISRFSPIGWEGRPKVKDEIENAKERLAEIEDAAGMRCRKVWPLGNHDARFETRLATVAPEYAEVNGVHLKDHFPKWEPCWQIWVNDDIAIKHRFKGGINATRNNTLFSGKSIFTGHLHSLKVWPHSDYNGTRWGGDTGTLADVYGPQFRDYTETNPLDWRSGFLILTIHKGRLLWPEIVHVIGHRLIDFRGKVIKV